MIFAQMEKWLDHSSRRNELENPRVAGAICEAFQHREHIDEWEVFEYVVMPTHIHFFFRPIGVRLKPAIEGFKDWTGHQASKHVDWQESRFWQTEWFDHWARSPQKAEGIKRYIRRNPVKAGLMDDYRDWPYGSWNDR
jgi:REP element-mobilizing transposase RayT